jgi:hypothetical protein
MDVKEVVNEAAKTPASTLNAATGAASSVIGLAGKPGGTVRRLERRGRTVNRKLALKVKQAAQPVAERVTPVLDGTLPERWIIQGLRIVKRQARRRDLVGLVAYRGMSTVHAGLRVAVSSLSRFERATEPPARSASKVVGTSPRRRAPGRQRGRRQ